MDTQLHEFAGLRRELEVGLCLAPTPAAAVAAAKAVASYLDADPRVAVRLAGVRADDTRVLLTLAVTLGTIDEIKAADDRSRAALALLARIVDDLAAYDPAFVAIPAPDSVEARAAATLLAEGPGLRSLVAVG